MKKIILAGGSGNLGQLLSKACRSIGYQVIILTRNKNLKNTPAHAEVYWDGEHLGDWCAYLEGAEVIINLSGKSIQCRYTEENKKLLLSSRIQSTCVIGQAIQKTVIPPRLWINFSGVSIFENLPPFHDESSKQYASTFLAQLSQQWEQAFWQAETPSATRKVCLRVSPVLAKDFGMLQGLYPLAKIGLAGTVGDGRQYISWIHKDDFVSIILWLINLANPEGTYHACAPQALPNKEFMDILRHQVHMPIGIPLPPIMALSLIHI